MKRPLRLTECSQPISWVNATLLTNRQQHYGKPQAALSQSVGTHLANRQQRYRKPSAAVGADSSCPHIRIRNAFAIRWDTFGNPLAALSQTVSSVTQTTSSRRDRFIVPTYTYSPCIRNPFEMPSRNVRNVFILCMLHIRYAKVWFLRHKSMVFGVQKPPFYIATNP